VAEATVVFVTAMFKIRVSCHVASWGSFHILTMRSSETLQLGASSH
jgi:hypothetical protein